MGILCQPIFDQTVGLLNLPVSSMRMRQLFYEFLSRYIEWKRAKFQELIAIFLIGFLGLFTLMTLWLIPRISIIFSLVIFLLFYGAVRHYMGVNERVSHSYVNVHILHHHLIGKLEVGFCEHHEPCQCAETFRYYVLKNYNISLYDRFLK